MTHFRVLIGCEDDHTGKRFEPGDTCTEADFSEGAIEGLIQAGALTPDSIRMAPKPKAKDARKVTDGGGQE